MDSDLEFDQTQAVVISDLEDDDLTDDLESSGEKGPSAYLRVLPQKGLPGSSYPVYEGDNIIGRQADSCHVFIPSKSLSKEHACIQIIADSHLIFDKGSRNKTRRGKLILKPEVRYELKHADEVSFADVKCVYEIVKQMSEIVPESDAETDAESDMSESLHLQHDVTDQSDKLVDLTGDKLDSSNRNVRKTAVQQTLILSESDSEDDDDGSAESLRNNRSLVQETVVFECSDDSSSLDLLGVATQAYAKTNIRKNNETANKSSKMIAETQKYFNDEAEEELVGTQSFDFGTRGDQEGTSYSGGTISKSIKFNVSKSVTKSTQAANKDAEELSDDAAELFALSTLAYESDDVVDVGDDEDDDESCQEVSINFVKAIADQDPTASSKTVSVPCDATVAVPSDATVTVPSDATVAVPSDATVAVPCDATVAVPCDATVAVCSDGTVAVPSVTSVARRSPRKRITSKTTAKSVGSAVKISSLRLAETLVTKDGTASEEHAEDSDDMPTQIFDETIAVGGSCSENASKVSGKRRGRYPTDAGCNDEATAPVVDVFPVSRKALAGSRSKGLQVAAQNRGVSEEPTQVFGVVSDEPTQAYGSGCDEPTQAYGVVSDEPTQAYGVVSDEPTQAYGVVSDEPTQAYGGISDEPTQAYGDISDQPTQVYGDISYEPTQVYDDIVEKPTQVRGGVSDKPTQILNSSSDNPTQILNDSPDKPTQILTDSSDKPTQILTDSSDKPAQVHDCTCEEPTQTFLIDSDDSCDFGATEKTRSGIKLRQRNDPLSADGTSKTSDKTIEESDEAQSVRDSDMKSDITGGSEDDADLDATQAFVDEENEDSGNNADKAEDPTQKYIMDAEEGLGKVADFLKGRTDDPSRRHLDSSDDSDLEELSLLKSSEGLLPDPSHLFESAGKSHTTLSTNIEPTLRYDITVSKDPTLPYDMAVEEPTLKYDMVVIKDPTLPYDMAVEELPGKVKKCQSLKRKGQKGNKRDGGKELDSSADTEETSDSMKRGTELSSPAVPLPAKSPLKSALVDRRRSPSPTPANRRVAFAVTVKEDSVDKQALTGEGTDTHLPLPSEQSDHGDPTPTRRGRPRGRKSLQQMAEFKQSNDEGSLGEFSKQGTSAVTSQRRDDVSGVEQSTEGGLETPEQKSGTESQEISKGSPHRTSTLGSKVHTVTEDANPVNDTPPLVEDSSKESLTPQAGNKRRKTRDVQGNDGSTLRNDGSIFGNEINNSSDQPASKKGRKSVAVKTEDVDAAAAGRRSSARPRKPISYQQLATGIEKKQTRRHADPTGEAEEGGAESGESASLTAGDDAAKSSRKSATSMNDSDIKSSRKSVVFVDDSNTRSGKKSATSVNDSDTKSSRESVVFVDDSNTRSGKKSATSVNDSDTKSSRESVVFVDDSNTKASRKSATSVDDSNTRSSKKSATSVNDSDTKSSRKSVVFVDDSNTKASRKSATSVDDNNTTSSKKSDTSVDDSNTRSSKKSATSVDDSNTRSSKKSATSVNDSDTKSSRKSVVFVDDSNTKASRKSATSVDDSNTKASKKSATSVDDNNTTSSKKSDTSVDDSNTRSSKKSATSVDDSNTRSSKKSATSENDSDTKSSKKSATSVDDNNTRSNKISTSVDDSNTKAGKKSVTSVDVSNTKSSKKSVTSVDENSNKVSKTSVTSVEDSKIKDGEKSLTSVDDSNTRPTKTPVTPVGHKNTRSIKAPVTSVDDSNTGSTKTPVTSVGDSNTRSTKTPVTSVDVSNTRSTKAPVTYVSDSETTARKKSIKFVNDSNTRSTKTPVTPVDVSNTRSTKTPVTPVDVSNTRSTKTPVTPVDDSNTRSTKAPVTSVSDSKTTARKKSIKFVNDSDTTAGEHQNIEMNTRRRKTAKPKKNTDKEDSKKTQIRKPAEPRVEEKDVDDAESDETASMTSSLDDRTVKGDETPTQFTDDSSTKGDKRLNTGVISENARRSRTTRTRMSDNEEALKKKSDDDVSSDTVSTTSRKRTHSKDPEADRKGQLGKSPAVAQNEILGENQRIKRAAITDDPGKNSSAATVGSSSEHAELNSSVRTVQNVKGRSGRAAKVGVSSEILTSMISTVSEHDSSQQSIGSTKIQQGQTIAEKTSRIGTRKSLQVEENGKARLQKQDKMQTSQVIRGRGKSRKTSEACSAALNSMSPIEEIQTPASRGRRATQSLASSEASADFPGSKISQSEVASSPTHTATSAKEPTHAAVKRSDIRIRGRKSERTETTISENVKGKAESDQKSGSEQDKNSQISATEKAKLSQQSAKEKDESSQNSTKLLKRRNKTDTIFNRDSSQSNENTEQVQEQISTPPAKKSKQTPVLRTPTGKDHTEKVDSPVLRKSSTISKPRVMFTGYLDKHGEKIVRDLGGELVTGVQECTHLVTDRICRTVKFLSGLAKGLLIVSPRWLESCKQAGTFVDGHQFFVSDPAMEKQYKFNLATSINKAQSGPLLIGYKVHVTRSVKPGPEQMQDILKFAGAQYMKTMPSKPQEKLVVVSCPEDQPLCLPAIKAGISVVAAEFILTGILKQELDLESYTLFQDEKRLQKEKGKRK